MLVAALFVRKDGVYSGRADVDLWDEERDARRYPGPHPVVAHPPCQRWGRFWAGSPTVIARTGVWQRLGDDGGCFAAALAAARRWGGVIEHPEESRAWRAFGLAHPPRTGGWISADSGGGWTCRVEQGRYGHHAVKPTWLLVYHCQTPPLDWGVSPPWQPPPELVARLGLARAKRRGAVAARGGGRDSPARTYTPEPFAALLIDIARTASPLRE